LGATNEEALKGKGKPLDRDSKKENASVKEKKKEETFLDFLGKGTASYGKGKIARIGETNSPR